MRLQGSLAYHVMFIAFAFASTVLLWVLSGSLWVSGLSHFKRIVVDSGPMPSHPLKRQVGIILVSIFALKLLQCDGASWQLLAGVVPAYRVAMVTSLLHLNCLGSRPRHQFPSSPIGDEFKWVWGGWVIIHEFFGLG